MCRNRKIILVNQLRFDKDTSVGNYLTEITLNFPSGSKNFFQACKQATRICKQQLQYCFDVPQNSLHLHIVMLKSD